MSDLAQRKNDKGFRVLFHVKHSDFRALSHEKTVRVELHVPLWRFLIIQFDPLSDEPAYVREEGETVSAFRMRVL